MVNEIEKRSTKTVILQLLRSHPSGISGEKIACELSVSRVAVWKAIQGLRTNGYIIHSDDRGYFLRTDAPDNIYPYEFTSSKYTFQYHKELDSTMTTALHRSIGGAPDGEVIISEIQHAGRGTETKKWVSTKNSLHFTLITRPNILPIYIQRYTMQSQIAMVKALSKISKKHIYPVWPNDIFAYDDKTKSTGKCGGILMESLSSGNTLSFVNIGIGINTQEKPDLDGTETTDTGRKEVLIQFLHEFSLLNTDDADLISLWQSLSPMKNATLHFLHNGIIKKGGLDTIDSYGNLVIDGNTFSPGQIHLQTKGISQ